MSALASPDGRYVWTESAYEMRMSQWVIGGSLHEVASQKVLFAAPSLWSFERNAWIANDVLELWGRKYDGSAPGLTLRLDVPREVATIELESLADLHAKGLYTWVTTVPAAPQGEQPLKLIKRWLDDYPRQRQCRSVS